MGLLENTWGSVYMGSGWEVKEAVFRRPGSLRYFLKLVPHIPLCSWFGEPSFLGQDEDQNTMPYNQERPEN